MHGARARFRAGAACASAVLGIRAHARVRRARRGVRWLTSARTSRDVRASVAWRIHAARVARGLVRTTTSNARARAQQREEYTVESHHDLLAFWLAHARCARSRSLGTVVHALCHGFACAIPAITRRAQSWCAPRDNLPRHRCGRPICGTNEREQRLGKRALQGRREPTSSVNWQANRERGPFTRLSFE